jgi:hypothetical protein
MQLQGQLKSALVLSTVAVLTGSIVFFSCGEGLRPQPEARSSELRADDEGASSYGACDLRHIAGAPFSLCRTYTGHLFAEKDYLESFRSSCVAGGGAFVEGADCPVAGAAGDCVFHGRSTYESIWAFYVHGGTAPATLKSVCLDEGGEWHEPGVFAAGLNEEEYIAPNPEHEPLDEGPGL